MMGMFGNPLHFPSDLFLVFLRDSYDEVSPAQTRKLSLLFPRCSCDPPPLFSSHDQRTGILCSVGGGTLALPAGTLTKPWRVLPFSPPGAGGGRTNERAYNPWASTGVSREEEGLGLHEDVIHISHHHSALGVCASGRQDLPPFLQTDRPPRGLIFADLRALPPDNALVWGGGQLSATSLFSLTLPWRRGVEEMEATTGGQQQTGETSVLTGQCRGGEAASRATKEGSGCLRSANTMECCLSSGTNHL
ncbi:hypothetical protein LY76DRAFT_127133 [Colletotrichum caudatum]|nr:hypothetical protein LY76DRAFT_127133 [Colletotrichum caudatum]